MNPDIISQSIQKGFRVTLGATASLIEAMQDPQGASQRFSEIGTDVNRLTEEFEVKGEATEQEARRLVDGMMTQMPSPFSQDSSTSSQTVNTVAMPVVDITLQTELENLTQELKLIREEIEALKGEQG